MVTTPLPTGVSDPSVIGEEEIAAVTEVLRGQSIFRYEHGDVAQFEQEAAKYLGVGYALMVNSGTSALVCPCATGRGSRGRDDIQRRFPGQAYLQLLGWHPGEAVAPPHGLSMERPQLQRER